MDWRDPNWRGVGEGLPHNIGGNCRCIVPGVNYSYYRDKSITKDDCTNIAIDLHFLDFEKFFASKNESKIWIQRTYNMM